MSNGLLSGLRIIEGSAFVAAPLGGMTLAALGADVIRFDDLGGGLDAKRWPITREGHSLYWTGLNKGKRSIAVDLRSPAGRDLITALIAAPGPDAGIFSTNLPAKGWLSYQTLAAKRGDLIMLTIIGARDGSAQVDYTVNAVAGFPMITGPAGHTGPINQVLPAWDIATGYAASTALLAAERHRLRHGRGQLIKLALQDVALSALSALGYLAEAEINGVDRPRCGNGVFGTFARDFITEDQHHLIICVFTERQLKALIEAGGFAEPFASIERTQGLNLRNEGDRWRAREQIAAVIEPWIAGLTLAEAGDRLSAAGVLWAPYKRPSDLIAGDPLLATNPMFQRVVQPGIGECWSAASPFDFSDAQSLPATPAPLLGQHTEAVLSGILGLSRAEMGKLAAQGVIHQAVGR